MSELIEQGKLEFEKVPVNEKDVLKIKRNLKGENYAVSFINEIGLETIPLPEGTLIKIEGYSFMPGAEMPETNGQIFYENGTPFYYTVRDGKVLDKKHNLKYRLQGGETIEILWLPKI